MIFSIIALENCLFDVPVLTKLSKSIRKRVEILSIFQKFLAAKFSFPPLSKLPCQSDLLKLAFNDHNSVCLPKYFFYLFGIKFESIPVVETVSLLVFDHLFLFPPAVKIDSKRY